MELLDQIKTEATFLVWIPGCSRGEEVYSLPIAPSDTKANIAQTTQRAILYQFAPTYSLVVDDDNSILKYVAQMLTGLGCRVDTAQEKPDVMKNLATGICDLLVTDLEMPEMNGYPGRYRAGKRAHAHHPDPTVRMVQALPPRVAN